MSHDSCGQSVAHHIDHGPESIPTWQGQKLFAVKTDEDRGLYTL